MTCHDPEIVVDALTSRLTDVRVGPFRVEYINDTGPGPFVESEHLALLERNGNVSNVIDIEDEYFTSLVEHYGATGVPEVEC